MTTTSALVRERQLLTEWLFDEALPLWWERAGDRVNGGFFERIGIGGVAIDDPRRTRVIGRQMYCYAAAIRLDWNGPGDVVVDHAVSFFFRHCLAPGGGLRSTVSSTGTVISADYDLYDYAFALFGLAHAGRRADRNWRLAECARGLRDHLIANWRHPRAGFHETMPPTAPLKSNPHMHMLEACLAWLETGPDSDGGWQKLADELVELCLEHLVDPDTGVLREYFTLNWTPMPDESGRVVEPGHQFEWAWLLLWWGQLRGQVERVRPLAERLVDLAERYGVCVDRGLAMNAVRDDLSVLDTDCRLWPQTERIKAHLALAQHAGTREKRERAEAHAAAAAAGLRRYFDTPVRGLWWETLGTDGQPEQAPARLSSLYHITCAIETLAASRLAALSKTPQGPLLAANT